MLTLTPPLFCRLLYDFFGFEKQQHTAKNRVASVTDWDNVGRRLQEGLRVHTAAKVIVVMIIMCRGDGHVRRSCGCCCLNCEHYKQDDILLDCVVCFPISLSLFFIVSYF